MENRQRLKIIDSHIKNGVVFVSSDGVVISPETLIGEGAVIYPGTVIEGESGIGAGCILGPDCMISDCVLGNGVRVNASQCFHSRIGSGTHVGPYCLVRPDCAIGEDAKIGAFTELKDTKIGDRSCVGSHCMLSGCAVGKDAEIAAFSDLRNAEIADGGRAGGR